MYWRCDGKDNRSLPPPPHCHLGPARPVEISNRMTVMASARSAGKHRRISSIDIIVAGDNPAACFRATDIEDR
jgi:hypothetical protein